MKIIKRKKGKQEYYYLQYSYRKENGKVITKQTYLGKEIPKNLEKIKKEAQKGKQQEIYGQIEKIKENFQKEWNKLPESIKEKKLEQIAISFTYNTNAIEGSTITLPETREILEDHIAPRKSIKDIKETENHAKILLEMIKHKEKITNELLLSWHKEIFLETKSDIAGKYREYGVMVAEYKAPDWQDIKNLLQNFITSIHDVKINPVELAARTHYKFEKIHPFGDGNGRIGRLLMNYILWHNKHPMLIIEYKKRRSYYKALTKDEEHFTQYFIKTYINIHKKRSQLT